MGSTRASLPWTHLGSMGFSQGTCTGQPARDEANAPAGLLDMVIVSPRSRPHQWAFVPRSMVPHELQGALAQGGRALAAPGQKLEGQRTHRWACGKPAPELLRHRGGGPQQHANRLAFQANPSQAVVGCQWQGKAYGLGDNTEFLAKTPVQLPMPPVDEADDRRLGKPWCRMAVKPPWGLGYLP